MDPDGVCLKETCDITQECDSLGHNAGESSQILSTSSSQGPEAPSAPSSTTTTTRSAEERLRQIRNAEDVKQRQLYAAMIEAQRQADLTRQKLQEDRRRKIEAMRQREEARRNSVLERRKEIELNTRARMDVLRQRSLGRMQDGSWAPSSAGSHPLSFRTASAAPNLGSSRHPSQLMTSSCLVAFGSSAPRSICTDSSASTSSRSASAEVLGNKKTTAPSVFQRLYAARHKKSSTISDDGNDGGHLSDGGKESVINKQTKYVRKPCAPAMLRTKKLNGSSATHGDSLNDKRCITSSQRELQRTISSSMYVERRVLPSTASSCVPEGPSSPTHVASDIGMADTHVERSTEDNSEKEENQINVHVEHPAVKSVDSVQPAAAESHSSNVAAVTIPALHAESNLSELPTPVHAYSEDDDNKTSNTSPSPPTSRVAAMLENVLEQPHSTESAVTPTIPTTTGTTCASTIGSSVVSYIHTGPLKAETHGSGDSGHLSESEAAIYRAKLVEQRRLAKERKEQEQRRLDEENRVRRERLEEARIAAEKALQVKLEATAKQTQDALEEAEEQQRIKKEEERAKQQILEAERAARLQKAEEERVLRKKRLDNIMSRVKPNSTNTASDNKLNSSSTPDFLSPRSVDVETTRVPSDELSSLTRRDFASGSSLQEQVPLPTEKSLLVDNNAVLGEHKPTSNCEPSEACAVVNEHSAESVVSSAITNTGIFNNGETSRSLVRPTFYSPQEINNLPDSDISTDQENVVTQPLGDPGERVITGLENENGITSFPPTSQEPKSTFDEVPPSLTDNISSQQQSFAPKFKSVLLQSMLGGGRLATHAKDAVAGLRRKSSATSLNTLDENLSAATVDVFDGFSTVPRNTSLNSPLIGNFSTASGDSPMIRSMFDRPLDGLHTNGSSSVH